MLGFFPPLDVVHTGVHEGQVFCPSINRAMWVFVLIVTGAFQHSSNLTAVFGACVGCVFICQSVLRLAVAWRVQRWPIAVLLAVGGPLMLVDGALASANVAKARATTRHREILC